MMEPGISGQEPPIRAELFSVERLEQHARSLAAAQTLAPRHKRGRPMAPRLYDNTKVLRTAYRAIAHAASARRAIKPAAEWMLDNFYIIDEQIREIKNDLPPGYYRTLPKLGEGPLAGYPRVFGIAWALVAHTDSAFDIEKLTRFVQAYQTVQPLTIGELWALAITLRITLVENLRRLAESIVLRLSASQEADTLADRFLAPGPQNADAVEAALNDALWSTPFVVQLAQRLRDRDPNTTPALRWLDTRLALERTSIDQIVREEVQRQSAMNVTVRNVITSMRMVSMVNWAEFFESVSPVDKVLRTSSSFAAMDFPTRDNYRRAVEGLARGSGQSEIAVAQRAVAAAEQAARNAKPDDRATLRECDPGFYLIGPGRRTLERALTCRVPIRTRIFRLNSRLGVLSYIGMIAIVTALVLAPVIIASTYLNVAVWVLAALAVAALVPASDVAVAIVNRIITRHVGPTLLPSMALRDGVPADLATIIVVPTILGDMDDIARQVERLEVHHLSNPDANFCYALLSDWRDWKDEHGPDDDRLLAEATEGIARLNAHYVPPGGGARFFLLHRRRLWNAGEDKWIGWERKRGKLHELNRLLRGAGDTTFITADGSTPSLPQNIRYVITLDADTRLPIGAARRMVGKMAHPLNQPYFDARKGRVAHGHGILQPRVTPSLPLGDQGSLYQRVFSGPDGLDPYALAVSDVYQDLFEEGSYSGKGIYEIDTFEAALEGQIPECSVLSHDLLEGILARAGLASDIEVVEEFPSRYNVAAARQHRWVRGDWQLLPWIFGFGARWRRNGKTSLPPMGRWKLLDNLRRSLSAPAAVLTMLLGWLLPLPAAVLWTGFVVLTVVLPSFVPPLSSILPPRRHTSWRNHIHALARDFELALQQSVFLLTFLAHQAWLMTDAVARTLYRLVVRRRLLEWVTAAQTNDDLQFDRRSLFTQMAASIAFALAAFALLYVFGNHPWSIAAPFTALWILSPLIAHWASTQPPSAGHLTIDGDDAQKLRMVARRTWRFFETFVTAADNMLPPDNFQEDPAPVIAHRTSPTNIGLYLLSTVSARDFGWIGTHDMLDRLEATMATMDRLERSRGHFYNWYETTDLRALEPKYISTVDSGNLAGHLIALSNTCKEIADAPACNPHWAFAVADNLALMRGAIVAHAAELHREDAAQAALTAALDDFAARLQVPAPTPSAIAARLDELAQKADALSGQVRLCPGKCESGGCGEIAYWTNALGTAIAASARDVTQLMPWAAIIARDPPPADVMAALDTMPTLAALADHCNAVLKALHPPCTKDSHPETALEQALEASVAAAARLQSRLSTLAADAKSLFDAMTFDFLFDQHRQLFSIGYRGADGTLDSNFYDLLASEARLASFVAIAKGDVPAKHWFHLGRTLTPIGRNSGLISWSGSMFEYLMPSLVMRAPAGSLLEHTNRLIVRRQEDYGRELGVPWGMSESGYFARDIEKTFQYSSFGVPDLGLKRGLSDNIVVAPYASGLAAMVDPAAAARNYITLQGLGVRGPYGWYEAVDYTPARLPQGTKFEIVRTYMAHHQGMTIVALSNALHDGQMRARFHAEPIVQATELLLQERVPRDIALARPPPDQTPTTTDAEAPPDSQRRYTNAHSRIPRTQLLSNGRLAAMVTAAGSGYTAWRDIALTRWREDVARDHWGSYVFLRDVRSGEYWSATYQPGTTEPDSYEVTFSEDRVDITRTEGSMTTVLTVAISPEDDAEVRRIAITNHGPRHRDIEITSYAELSLARQADDIAHPAFAKMFVETEFVRDMGVILATRRQRSSGDPMIWAAHLSVVEGDSTGDVQFETDRARFIGRGQTIRTAAAITEGWPLSNTAGAVLDPIFSLRRRVRIPRGATARIAFWTVAAESRDAVMDLADKHHDAIAFDRATTLAWTQAQMQLHHLGIAQEDAQLFQRLANHILYSDPVLRPAPATIQRNLRRASTLWPQGISGDLPIVLVRVCEEDELTLVHQLLRAHEYWRMKQLAVDLVILNDRGASYVQDFHTAIDTLVRTNRPAPPGDSPRGGVYVLRADLVPPDIRNLLFVCARAVLHGDRGSLRQQIDRARDLKPGAPPPARPQLPPAPPEPPLPRPELQFFNGVGGFSMDGREYITILDGNDQTPAPWANVIANPDFGFLATTSGSGFTWALNSQQNLLTPWSNDPVSDAPGEAIYLRDEDSGELWCPTPLPIREKNAAYTIHHGQGYSRFEYTAHGIALDLLQFVPVSDSIKIARLKLSNQSLRERRLSVTAYVEWVLGQNRARTQPFIVTTLDSETGALLARNPWNEQFGTRVSFMDMNGKQTGWTGDRIEFIGRDGGLDFPNALAPGATLSNHTGAALDPCGVLQTTLRLPPAGTKEVVLFLGQAGTDAEVRALIAKYRKADLDAAFDAVTRQWDDICGTVQVKTPDRALDVLLNRWIPYQALSCRIWARTGFYQASGAYGFRDQLQDVLSVCLSRPDVARAQLLRAAGRQFPEGDVQHWWLPESGRGIRTRIKDDRIWLAYAAAQYIQVTGDDAILNQPVPYLDGPALREDQHDSFFEPQISEKQADLYTHCALALDTSLATGAHGLPLMGAGDWNDGMDRVGAGGKGESVWLGWFLYATLDAFAALAEQRKYSEHAERWRAHMKALADALENEAWDGDWYRRAYFDDGTPLGSVSNDACRIDSIAQSWSVISRAAAPKRAARAMAALDKYLVRRDDKLLLLFTPPFDHPTRDPGYIKGYPPGIRENGGQYTHGALWAVLAFAMQGDGDRAGELLTMLNPVHHAGNPNDVHRYKVEPYVICADLYAMPPHTGRGGWTWYTGSAGWFYRVALEWFLGLRVQGSQLTVDPCIPRHWPGFEITYRYRSATYEISVENPLGVNRGILATKLDGRMLTGKKKLLIPLADDGTTHKLQIVLG